MVQSMLWRGVQLTAFRRATMLRPRTARRSAPTSSSAGATEMTWQELVELIKTNPKRFHELLRQVPPINKPAPAKSDWLENKKGKERKRPLLDDYY
jgi:hypothetical protein